MGFDLGSSGTVRAFCVWIVCRREWPERSILAGLLENNSAFHESARVLAVIVSPNK
jgi:hypothetical protein